MLKQGLSFEVFTIILTPKGSYPCEARSTTDESPVMESKNNPKSSEWNDGFSNLHCIDRYSSIAFTLDIMILFAKLGSM